VGEVFGFVKRNDPERSGGRLLHAGKGVRGRGRQSPLSNVEVRRASARRPSTTFFPHRITAHFNAVGVVNQAVENAIRYSGVADLLRANA